MTGQQGDKEGKKNTTGDNATTPPNEEKSPEKAPPKSPGKPGTEADQDPPAAETGKFPNQNPQSPKEQEQDPAHATEEQAPAPATKPKTTGAREKESAGASGTTDNQSWRRFSVSDSSAFDTGVFWNKETMAEIKHRKAREAEYERTMQHRADEAMRHSLERSSWESRNRNVVELGPALLACGCWCLHSDTPSPVRLLVRSPCVHVTLRELDVCVGAWLSWVPRSWVD